MWRLSNSFSLVSPSYTEAHSAMVFGIFLYVCAYTCTRVYTVCIETYPKQLVLRQEVLQGSKRKMPLATPHANISLGTKGTVVTTRAMLMRCDLSCKGGSPIRSS